MLNKIRENWIFYILLFIISVLAFWGLGKYGFKDWDESIYAEISKNVLRGNWLTLIWERGEPWFQKPPLYFWISAVFFKLLGINEFAARFTSVLSGISLSALIYLLAKKLFSQKAGIFALALILLNSSMLYQFRFATIDVLVLLFNTFAVYYFWLSQQDKKYLLCSFIFIGLAMMTKGPVAISVVLSFFLYVIITGQSKEYLKSKFLWSGLAICLLISAPWHYYMLLRYGQGFYDQYLLYHIFKRASESIEGHAGGVWYYPQMILRGLPSVIFIPGIFLIPRAKLREKRNELIFLGILLITQYISIDRVATKLEWYILPVFVPLQILLAYILSELIGKKRWLNIVIVTGLVLSAAIVARVSYSHLKQYRQQEDARRCLMRYKDIVNLTKQDYLTSNFNMPNLIYYLDSDKIVPVTLDSPDKWINENDLIVDATDKNTSDYEIMYSNDTCRILRAK